MMGHAGTKSEKLEIAYLADQPAHIQTCASWTYGLWGCQSGATYEQILDKFVSGANKKTLPITFVALYDGKPAGMVSFWTSDASRPEFTPWLSALYVHPFYRGKGISIHLIDQLIAEAVRLAYTELYLMTETAQALYEKFGWTEIQQLTTPYGESVLMKKALN